MGHTKTIFSHFKYRKIWYHDTTFDTTVKWYTIVQFLVPGILNNAECCSIKCQFCRTDRMKWKRRKNGNLVKKIKEVKLEGIATIARQQKQNWQNERIIIFFKNNKNMSICLAVKTRV